MIERTVTALYVDDLARSKAFYCNFIGLQPAFEADWIIQLSDPDNPVVELMLQPRMHELIPEAYRKPPQGSSLVFVVPDCDAYYRKAQSMGLPIISEPKNEAYGQRRFLTVDPDGVLIDVSSNSEPSAEFMARYFG
ncbi:VOC family protein [Saccharospirillum impatiens]|uniref:VOC family protein n=1 Tax=Saccharospirillum impatiens TaxID=169438 RepID=UPI00041AF3D5|nr:VOC family protein [Saccharospirillum impatiens]